ncbi:hypothetical protein HanRHA438_Chr00c19g0851891 [Helianthus annuus]|nr:hypothetical protein HanRHA438_Chr00c19g0851891 [Helianthus annuus]
MPRSAVIDFQLVPAITHLCTWFLVNYGLVCVPIKVPNQDMASVRLRSCPLLQEMILTVFDFL